MIIIILMIKNEATSIQATLLSFLQEGFHDFFILDTGSTDNTVSLIQQFFSQHKINGIIEEEPFVDFATSRNRALTLAENDFPNADFFLMVDAEWHIRGGHELIQFCKKEQKKNTPLYLIHIKMNSLLFGVARLFRASARVRFAGVVHEVPVIPTKSKVPDTVYFEMKSSSRGIEKSRQRWQQDLQLLAKEHAKNPTDPRTTFYFAQTYECLGDLENAFRLYQQREKLPGWDEENFITLFRLGCLSDQLSKINHNYSWNHAMEYFLKAFSLRPHRIEPLVKIANHYWPSNIQTCYLFIRYAYAVPYPKDDILFIEKEMYDYDRYEIMSRCAWYMGHYLLGKEATEFALQQKPNTPHLERNLVLYEKKLAEID